MAKGELLLYVWAFTIDGIKHGGGGHALTKDHAIKHIERIVKRRNEDVPSEKTVFDPADIQFGVTSEAAEAYLSKLAEAIPDGEKAEDLTTDSNERLLHSSVADLKATKESDDIQNLGAALS